MSIYMGVNLTDIIKEKEFNQSQLSWCSVMKLYMFNFSCKHGVACEWENNFLLESTVLGLDLE